MDFLDKKLNEMFAGRVVRKDLTQRLKGGINVPVFVLEYLLGMYCASDDQDIIDAGIKKVKEILDNNFMRYDESDLIKSRIREQGIYTIIDKISATLDSRNDVYSANFSNLQIGSFQISPDYINKYEKILTGGIWVIAKVSYKLTYGEAEMPDELFKKTPERKGRYIEVLDTPFQIESIKPIQMSNIDFNEIHEYRSQFTKDEWIDVLVRSSGLEPSSMDLREKFHVLLRLVPFVEKNYNLVELGPRSTGKSYLFKELSPYSILVSGGYSSSANLFYNIASRRMGLVGLWDVVAFDEVAGMVYRDLDSLQIMKDYMTSGSFTRGREALQGDASLVFIGNINDKPEDLLKISHLFDPFPEGIRDDSAFFDRIHYYLPGWEVPKLKASYFTDNYGFITDYLSEFFREIRKRDFNNVLDDFFMLNRDVNKRDEIGIRKTVAGLTKLLYPTKEYSKEDIEELLIYATEGRKRVKEQLYRMAGDEFADTNLGFIDLDTQEETIVYTTEQPKGAIVTSSRKLPGHVFTIGTQIHGEDIGIFKLENKVVLGQGKFKFEGIKTRAAQQCFYAAWAHFKDKLGTFIPNHDVSANDYLMSFIDPLGRSESDDVSLAEIIGLFSAALSKPIQSGLVVVGHYNLAGSLSEVKKLGDIFRVAKNAGATSLLIPIACANELNEVSQEYLNVVQPVFYNSLTDAIIKALAL